MQEYKRKNKVKAIKFEGNTIEEIGLKLVSGAMWKCKKCGQPSHKHGEVTYQIICPGQYAVAGLPGSYYGVDAEDFERIYERV